MKTEKCRDAPDSLTRGDAAAALGVSTYWADRLVRENKLLKDPQKRITRSSLERFQIGNAKKIEAAQAEVLHAYDLGLSMNLIEIVADNAIRNNSILLPGKPTARQFTYQTIYNYIMKEKKHGCY
ncbi:DNA-binding protein [uncultured Oscillibacter sp.]|uniref:DNA-binding protein n=1 Tax=uncultured Oscillibacter sp. TaxID=876091 RepID=UPI0025E39A1C|nr:DNA-binding protein [uncultured Oscillibacter sp.]